MWVRLDDGFFDHPKARIVGKDGRELYLAGLCRVAETLSDGFIPTHELPLVAAKAEVRPKPTAKRLVDADLWELVEGGWIVHDYHDYNPTAEAELEKKRKRAEAGRKGGLRSRPPRRGEAAAEANASANASAEGEARTEQDSKQIGTPSPSSSPLAVTGQSVTSTEHSSATDDDDREPAEQDLLAARLVASVSPDEEPVIAAAVLLGDRDFERAVADGVVRANPGTPGFDAYRQRCIERWCSGENRGRLDGLAVEHPGWDADQLATAAVAPAGAAPARHLAAVPRTPEPDPDCPYCEGDGVFVDEDRRSTACACSRPAVAQ